MRNFRALARQDAGKLLSKNEEDRQTGADFRKMRALGGLNRRSSGLPSMTFSRMWLASSIATLSVAGHARGSVAEFSQFDLSPSRRRPPGFRAENPSKLGDPHRAERERGSGVHFVGARHRSEPGTTRLRTSRRRSWNATSVALNRGESCTPSALRGGAVCETRAMA